MIHILTAPQKAVRGTLNEPGCAFILCIADPYAAAQIPPRRNVLILSFQDTDDAKRRDAFQMHHAQQISAFFAQMQNAPETDALFVCCDAGVSRSPAIAAALMRKQGENDDAVWDDAAYAPNPLVYRRLCAALGVPVSEDELQRKMQRSQRANAGG